MSVVILVVGQAKATTALQTIIIAMGLPWTILISMVCIAMKSMFDMELHHDTNWDLTVSEGRYDLLASSDNGIEFWSTSIIGSMSIVDSVLQGKKVETPTTSQWKVNLMSLVCPYWQLGRIHLRATARTPEEELTRLHQIDMKSDRQKNAQMFAVGSGFFFISAGCFLLSSKFVDNMWAIGYDYSSVLH